MANELGRKVSRAARTGGGATSRGDRPYGWYFALFLIFAIGVPLVLISRNQRLDDLHPTAGDHWHTNLGWFVCDKYVDPLQGVPEGQQTQTPLPILHTHTAVKSTVGDGLIHVEPTATASPYEGKNATFGAFINLYPQYGKQGTLKVSKTSFQRPGETVHKNGDKCGDKTANVKILTWKPTISDVKNKSGAVIGHKYVYDNGSEEFTGDPNTIRLRDGLGITVAIVPDGTEVVAPPTKQLNAASAIAIKQENTTTTRPKKTSTTTTSKSTTTSKGTTTSTKAG